MPHKDRDTRLAYSRQHHATYRPSPAPQPQDDLALPPLGVLIDDGDRVQCHVCGRWYGSLVRHVRIHGYDADRYKERYELARTTSLLGPTAKERHRQAALARNQGEIGRQYIPPPIGRAKGIAMRRQSRLRMSEHSARRIPAPSSDDRC